MKKCKSNNIHTALDTSGVGNGYYEEILKYVDLVILDIKHIDYLEYEKITGYKMDEFNKFLSICEKLDKKLWLRQVIIPGINDNIDYIKRLKEYIKNIKNVLKIELLPYHLYGVDKYKRLNIEYKLKETKAMNINKCNELYEYLIKE